MSGAVEPLSPRERQVAEAYASGLSYKQIAAELNLAPGTIRTHLGKIYRKLGVSTKIELLRALERLRAETEAPEPEGRAPDARPEAEATAPERAPIGAGQGGLAATRVTVAVLRPDSDEHDGGSARFALNVAKALVRELANHPDIAVVARSSSFAADPDEEPVALAARLRADYLLHSAATLSEDGARGAFELTDGESGRAIWAERINHSGESQGEIEDALVTDVVNHLVGWNGELHRAQLKRIAGRDPATLNAFEYFILACSPTRRIDEAATSKAIPLLERALALDPCFARCWLVKSVTLHWAYDLAPGRRPELLEGSGAAIERAYDFEPRDATILSLLALKRARDGDDAGAQNALRRAAEGCGGFCDACMTTASAHVLIAGEFEEAAALMDRAFALNPSPPGWYRFIEARLAFYLEEYERAILAAQTGAEHVSGVAYALLSHAAMGDADGLRAAHADFTEAYPDFDFVRYADDFPVAHPEARRRFDAALTRMRRMLDG